MNLLTTQNNSSARKTRLLTVLDVGSSKVVCIIARLRPLEDAHYLHGRTHRIEVLGFGIQRSRGVKSGVVVDLTAAEQSIRLAVDAAERMAGLVVDSVIVNFSAGRIRSDSVHADVNVGGSEVSARDVRRVLSEGSKAAFNLDRHIVHSLPISYSLDGENGIADPRGMIGTSLGVDMHVVTAESAAMRNLEHCINRAHLSVEAMVVTPFASGLSVMVGDEARLGAACIDIGGGTTTISVFVDDKFVHTDTIPVGGNHVTLDIARGFTIPVEEAERLKVMHGSALSVSTDDRFLISVPPMDDQNALPAQYPRALLSRIIRARVDEILELARDRLARSGFGYVVGKRLILTGGGAQLTGFSEVARHMLSPQLRIGRPLGVSGLPDMARGAAFSAIVGLMIYPQMSGFEDCKVQPVSSRQPSGEGRFLRVGRWLRESF